MRWGFGGAGGGKGGEAAGMVAPGSGGGWLPRAAGRRKSYGAFVSPGSLEWKSGDMTVPPPASQLGERFF